MRVSRDAVLALFLAMSVCLAAAKDKKPNDKSAAMVLLWPDQTNPSLRLSFGKFNQLAAYNGQLSLESNVLIENLSGKRIPQASFTVYMMDKDGVRVGNGMIAVSDLEAGQQARLAFQVMSVGIPAGLRLVASNDSAGIPTSVKTVPLKVVSVPPAANLKVDGRDVGVTPISVPLTIGTHNLSFSKEGYASGSTPVEIKADEAPGGSISFELGGLSRDSVELRNGAVLQGDVISMSMTEVVIRVEGRDQSYPRNQVKKIILVERITEQQPAVVQPAPNSQPHP